MKKVKKILSLVLCFAFLFQQAGFAQAIGELNISGYLGAMRNNFVPDKFRPLHLRYFSYDTINNQFKILLDKGDAKKLEGEALKKETKELFNYFLIGVTLPNSTFWVNLRPDSENEVIEDILARTDIGKVLLEADVQLKKDTAKFTSPATPEGRVYWDKLYSKAGELFGNENVTIPTLTRPWIVPNEIIIRETKDSAYIYKATLKVMLEQDHLKNSATYNFKDPRLKALNEYSSQLIREQILPKLTKEVNLSKRYAPLRQVFYSLVLARWFKSRFAGQAGTYSNLIDRQNLNGLTSKESWSKTTYFQAYQKSFKDGEYNIQEPAYTPYGQVIRSYFSGGANLDLTNVMVGEQPVGGGFLGRNTNVVLAYSNIGPVIQVTPGGPDGVTLTEQSPTTAGESGLIKPNQIGSTAEITRGIIAQALEGGEALGISHRSSSPDLEEAARLLGPKLGGGLPAAPAVNPSAERQQILNSWDLLDTDLTAEQTIDLDTLIKNYQEAVGKNQRDVSLTTSEGESLRIPKITLDDQGNLKNVEELAAVSRTFRASIEGGKSLRRATPRGSMVGPLLAAVNVSTVDKASQAKWDALCNLLGVTGKERTELWYALHYIKRHGLVDRLKKDPAGALREVIKDKMGTYSALGDPKSSVAQYAESKVEAGFLTPARKDYADDIASLERVVRNIRRISRGLPVSPFVPAAPAAKGEEINVTSISGVLQQVEAVYSGLEKGGVWDGSVAHLRSLKLTSWSELIQFLTGEYGKLSYAAEMGGEPGLSRAESSRHLGLITEAKEKIGQLLAGATSKVRTPAAAQLRDRLKGPGGTSLLEAPNKKVEDAMAALLAIDLPGARSLLLEAILGNEEAGMHGYIWVKDNAGSGSAEDAKYNLRKAIGLLFQTLPPETYLGIIKVLREAAAAKDRVDFNIEVLRQFSVPVEYKEVLKLIQDNRAVFEDFALNFHDWGYFKDIQEKQIANPDSPIIDTRLFDKEFNPRADELLACLTPEAQKVITERHSRDPAEKIKLGLVAIQVGKEAEFFRLAGKNAEALGKFIADERAKEVKKQKPIINTLQVPYAYLVEDAKKYGDKKKERLAALVKLQESGIAWAVAILRYAQLERAKGRDVDLQTLMQTFHAGWDLESLEGQVESLMRYYHAGWSLSNDWGQYGYDPLAAKSRAQLGAEEIKKDWMCLKVVIEEMGLSEEFADIMAEGKRIYEGEAAAPAEFRNTPRGSNISSQETMFTPIVPAGTSAPGGIDFRQMNIIAQPMGSFTGLNFNLPILKNVANINLDKELQQIKGMVNKGMMPSGTRLKEFVAACYQRGELAERIDDLVVCLVDICKLEEEQISESPAELKEVMVIIDSDKLLLSKL